MICYVIEMQTEVCIFGLALIYHLGWIHISAIVLYFLFSVQSKWKLLGLISIINNEPILPPGFYLMFDFFKLTGFSVFELL